MIETSDVCGSGDAVANPPGKAPNERDKLIQVFGAGPADDRAERNNRETEHILLPLDEKVLLPAPGE